MEAFDVYKPNPNSKTGRLKKIDTVFYSEGDKIAAEEVRRSLINHDGYDYDITVRRGKKYA